MADTCCVEGCVPAKDDVTYFKFPNSRTLRRKWLDAMSMSIKVTLETTVCSQHFLPDQYEVVRGKKRLKAKVVPSIFDKTKPDTKPSSPQKDKSDSSDSEDSIPIQRAKSVPTDNADTEQSRHSPDHRLDEDRQDDEGSLKNGVQEDDIVKRSEPENVTITDSESNKDIEDIITNYQIKQIRPLHKPTDDQTDRRTPDLSIEIEVPPATGGETGTGVNGEVGRNGEMDNVIDVDDETEPVFIEVAVGKGGEVEEAVNEDCMMLLESVQCEVDPSSLMFPAGDDPGDDPGDDSDVVDLGEKKEDPVSLLTSSDEDEVIIEEPKYEMIEVSDETDEDDVPLVKLVEKPKINQTKPKTNQTKPKTNQTKKKKTKLNLLQGDNLSKILWGQLYEYYCMECRFSSTSNAELRRHVEQAHSNVIQVCNICSYTTSSKQLYAKHKRKHREDKRFKCHLCKYSARHNMSLIYHLKSHDNVQIVNEKGVFKCEKCNLVTDFKEDLLKHVRACSTRAKQFSCSKCDYETDRKADMKRHRLRRHDIGEEDDDDDEYVPTGAKKAR